MMSAAKKKKKKTRRQFSDKFKRHALWLAKGMGQTKKAADELKIVPGLIHRWASDGLTPKKDLEGGHFPAASQRQAAATEARKKPAPKTNGSAVNGSAVNGSRKPATGESIFEAATAQYLEAIDDEIAVEREAYEEKLARLTARREIIAGGSAEPS